MKTTYTPIDYVSQAASLVRAAGDIVADSSMLIKRNPKRLTMTDQTRRYLAGNLHEVISRAQEMLVMIEK